MENFLRREVPAPGEDPLGRPGARRAKPPRTKREVEAAIAEFRENGREIVKVSAAERPPQQEPLLRHTRDLTVAIRLLLIEALNIEVGDEFEHETFGKVKIRRIGNDGRVIYQRMDTGQIMPGWASTLALVVKGQRIAEIIGWKEGEKCKISLAHSRQQLIAVGLLKSEVS